MERSSERASERRTGTMQRERGDGREQCSESAETDGGLQRSGDGRAHVERRSEVVRIYGKGQGACTVQYGMVLGVCELGVLWSVHARG
jgi:hypothetical protein